jgi:hypothetical protein
VKISFEDNYKNLYEDLLKNFNNIADEKLEYKNLYNCLLNENDKLKNKSLSGNIEDKLVDYKN